MRISDWSSDVCSSDLLALLARIRHHAQFVVPEGDVEHQLRDAEAIDLGRVQRHVIVFIGQALAERAHREIPRAVFAHAVLHRGAEAFRPGGRAAGAALKAVAALETDAVVLTRSEEHTSELQSLMRISYAVFCLKKKTH